jgi:Ca2+-binding EF-hand superfamily protein
VVNAINVGKSSGFISESELQAALFLDLPYSPLGNNREEVVEVGDISNNVSESFPEFNEATHPDVQAGVDITDAAVTEYILSSNS